MIARRRRCRGRPDRCGGRRPAGLSDDVADDSSLDAVLDGARADFEAAMDDDLNISPALASLFELIREFNRRIDARSLSTIDAERGLALIADIDTVLGVTASPESELTAELVALLDARSAARTARDWAESDRLRDELLNHGVAVEDTRDGQRWRRVEVPTRA
jgi:cysteinyl-tRNA synthetase